MIGKSTWYLCLLVVVVGLLNAGVTISTSDGVRVLVSRTNSLISATLKTNAELIEFERELKNEIKQ